MNTNKIFLVFALIFTTFASSQVGIGTQNPQGIFNIDGAKDNATSGAPTATQQRNDFVVMPSGRVGIGTTAPTSNIEVLSSDVSTFVNTASFYAPSNIGSGNNTLLNFGVSASQGNSAQFRFVYTGSDAVTNRVDLGMNGYFTPFVTYTRLGNVGIGTTAPTEKLDVVGKTKTTNFQMTNGATNGAFLVSDAQGNASWDNSFRQSGNVVMSVGSSNTFTTTIPSGFITITAINGCGRPMIALFAFTGNTIIHLNSVARNAIGNATSLNADNTSWGVTFSSVLGCGDGGGTGPQFDFSISKSGNIITLSGYTYAVNKNYTIKVTN